jgi:hypothetical protein
MVIVQVISAKTGEPIKGKIVSVGTTGFLSGGVTERQFTNSRGEVEFPRIGPCDSGTIFVEGKSLYKGKIEGFQRIYI